MLKKIFLLASFVLLGGALTQMKAQVIEDITFEVGFKKDGAVLGDFPRSPITPPSASLDDHTLYIEGEHPAYMLYLVDFTDEEPDVVYQVYVPTNVGIVYLPTTLTGIYELELYDGGAYYFYSEIEL